MTKNCHISIFNHVSEKEAQIVHKSTTTHIVAIHFIRLTSFTVKKTHAYSCPTYINQPANFQSESLVWHPWFSHVLSNKPGLNPTLPKFSF